MTKTQIAETDNIAEIDARIAEIIAEAQQVSHDETVIYPGSTGVELDELIERRIGILLGDEIGSTR